MSANEVTYNWDKNVRKWSQYNWDQMSTNKVDFNLD